MVEGKLVVVIEGKLVVAVGVGLVGTEVSTCGGVVVAFCVTV